MNPGVSKSLTRSVEGAEKSLTTEQLNWLLDGYDIWTQPHRMLKFNM
jgi:hypothetical protein